ncbi:MAG: cupin domain-containing protein [Candidatus Poseidoniales archaeon]|nr:cupin domain-containing protein [Candidatus Poseidoniales archaeon]
MCKKIQKGWGHELIIQSNDQYCLKELHFYEKGHRSSMHFHKNKTETWKIQAGAVQVELIDLKDSSRRTVKLEAGDTLHLEPMTPHQVTSLEGNTVIIEASSKDTPEDNYRISPGDSQKSTS